MLKRQLVDLRRVDPTAGNNEFHVLHPSADLTDEHGELSQLLLGRWSVDAGEDAFSSVTLFCEMKLNEAKRMTSWVDRPNRFYTAVCCQLLDKYANHVEIAGKSNNDHHHHNHQNSHAPTTATTTVGCDLLRQLHHDLVDAIFMPPTPNSHDPHDYSARVPYFAVSFHDRGCFSLTRLPLAHRLTLCLS